MNVELDESLALNAWRYCYVRQSLRSILPFSRPASERSGVGAAARPDFAHISTISSSSLLPSSRSSVSISPLIAPVA